MFKLALSAIFGLLPLRPCRPAPIKVYVVRLPISLEWHLCRLNVLSQHPGGLPLSTTWTFSSFNDHVVRSLQNDRGMFWFNWDDSTFLWMQDESFLLGVDTRLHQAYVAAQPCCLRPCSSTSSAYVGAPTYRCPNSRTIPFSLLNDVKVGRCNIYIALLKSLFPGVLPDKD